MPLSGETCYSLANANGLGISFLNGTISNPSIELVVDGFAQKYIQTSIQAHPGCSGGCLLDRRGQCIGMIAFRTKDAEGNPIIDFSYSISSRVFYEEARSILNESARTSKETTI